MDVQARLRTLAEEKCLPYLLGLPEFAPHVDRLCLVLVGSAATGGCDEDSDVDIAVACDEDIYRTVSRDRPWESGRPSEAVVDWVQLHYYAISFDTIEARLRELDDAYLYVYGNAVVLHDPVGAWSLRLRGLLSSGGSVRKERIEGKLDMLLRRSKGLKDAVRQADVLGIARVCLEVIPLSVKVTALLDDVPFNPHKRLFSTGLRGDLGRHLEGSLRGLLSAMGELGDFSSTADFGRFSFPQRLDEIVAALSEEAARQDFQVGLDRGDHRHLEG